MIDEAIAYAPASVANVIVGFDVLGFSIPILYDKVTAKKIENGVVINSISGVVTKLPFQPEENTAGYAIIKMIEGENLRFGISLDIEKGIPLGSGLGGSAASAVAAVVAVNHLLENPLPKSKLLEYAIFGESVASGSFHGDNVGASLFGGLIACIRKENGDVVSDFEILQLPIPDFVYCLIIHPHFELKTKMAREIVKPMITMQSYVKQTMFLTSFLVGCYNQDSKIIQSSLKDIIIEPQRSKLIPDFTKIKKIVQQFEILGFSISGAGPSMFAWCSSKNEAEKIQNGIYSSMNEFSHKLDVWITQIDSKGAYIIEDGKK
ncbi:MAG: Homoserine kinase [Candidatus Heimdallarchaeota archaeon LC_2]|nr:MAG: Homoserine kinase [Candidatus Heimdallarchaeota archaeon LC_2]